MPSDNENKISNIFFASVKYLFDFCWRLLSKLK